MTDKEYMDQGEQYLIHTYNRFKIVLDKGEGVYLYDVNGKKYLDFAAGIAVFALGYGNYCNESFFPRKNNGSFGINR